MSSKSLRKSAPSLESIYFSLDLITYFALKCFISFQFGNACTAAKSLTQLALIDSNKVMDGELQVHVRA